MVYPNGRELHYTYAAGNDDATGRVTSITDTDDTELASYTYLGLGQVLAVTYQQPGVSYDLTHTDGNGQYDRLDQFGRVKNAIWSPTSGSALVDLRYGYDLAGNRIWREDAVADGSSQDLDERYWYDSLSQLVDMQRGELDFTNPSDPIIVGGDLSQQWDLDATGNWDTITTGGTPQTREHDAANQMTEIDGSDALLRYDAAGNMTTMPQPAAPTQAFNLKWDAWNRLAKVTTGSGASEKTVAEYRYDGLNRRIVKKTFDSEGALAETRHFYLSDQNQVLEERVDGHTGIDRQNVWGLRYIDDLVLRDWDSDRDGATTDGSLGADGSGLNQRHYAMQDANWNVVAIVGMDGAVAERYTFTAYGKCEVRMDDFTPDADGKSDFDWRSLYTTREFDPETGMYYYRARYYYAEMGRFVGRDPIGYNGGISFYRYVANKPLDAVDALGLVAATTTDPLNFQGSILALLANGMTVKEVALAISGVTVAAVGVVWSATTGTMVGVGVYGGFLDLCNDKQGSDYCCCLVSVYNQLAKVKTPQAIGSYVKPADPNKPYFDLPAAQKAFEKEIADGKAAVKKKYQDNCSSWYNPSSWWMLQ